MNIAQTINRCAGYQGMPDDQLGNEYRAKKALEEAVAAMTAAIAKVNFSSSVVTIPVDAWAEFIHDNLPSDKYWTEQISAARSK